MGEAGGGWGGCWAGIWGPCSHAWAGERGEGARRGGGGVKSVELADTGLRVCMQSAQAWVTQGLGDFEVLWCGHSHVHCSGPWYLLMPQTPSNKTSLLHRPLFTLTHCLPACPHSSLSVFPLSLSSSVTIHLFGDNLFFPLCIWSQTEEWSTKPNQFTLSPISSVVWVFGGERWWFDGDERLRGLLNKTKSILKEWMLKWDCKLPPRQQWQTCFLWENGRLKGLGVLFLLLVSPCGQFNTALI